MKLSIGCPTNSRAWIAEEWTNKLAAAVDYATIYHDIEEVQLIIVADESDDSIPIMLDNWDEEFRLVPVKDDRKEDVRDWSHKYRIDRMVELRNILLGAVREEQPNYFLSLDSDILLDFVHISYLLDLAKQNDESVYAGFGGRIFLNTHQKSCTPNYIIKMPRGRMHRPDSSAVIDVDVLLALKLLNKIGYSFDYKYDTWGEDLGWADNVRSAGYKFKWSGLITSKHVMHERDLNAIDERLGW